MLKRRTFVLASGMAAALGTRRGLAQPARTLRMTYLYAADSQFGAAATAHSVSWVRNSSSVIPSSGAR